MGPAATGLNQQGHSELHRKDWASIEAEMDISNVERWTLKVTVHFSV